MNLNVKKRALEPKNMFCSMLKKKVLVLVEYDDYKNRNNKGFPGTYYCAEKNSSLLHFFPRSHFYLVLVPAS